MTHSYVTVSDFFFGQCKIIMDGKLFPMRCRPSPFPCPLWRQVIYDGIRSGIPYNIKVFIFVYDGDRILFLHTSCHKV